MDFEIHPRYEHVSELLQSCDSPSGAGFFVDILRSFGEYSRRYVFPPTTFRQRRPVQRVAALDTFVAYAPQVEDAILPQVADVLASITALHGY